ncbi:hypothetical protein PSYMO_37991, partial [Pseudomonas amygdali pv. mori str. 301020]
QLLFAHLSLETVLNALDLAKRSKPFAAQDLEQLKA